MDELTKYQLSARNQAIIKMVIERARRDFPDDIALIGLTGSFQTGDFHSKSDLDLIIISNNERAQGIASCFLLDGIGYDIYCTPWEPRVADEARLVNPMVAHVVDLEVLYAASPADLARFQGYQEQARQLLAEPFNQHWLERATLFLDKARLSYADLMLADTVGAARLHAGQMSQHLFGVLTQLNTTYFKRGIKRHLDEVAAYPQLPPGFVDDYRGLVNSRDVGQLHQTATRLLKGVIELARTVADQIMEQPQPSRDNLVGSYEEFYCDFYNKIVDAVEQKNAVYAFAAAVAAQEYLNEMAAAIGTPRFDLLQHFSADDLEAFKGKLIEVMDQYLAEYQRVGLPVRQYASVEALEQDFLRSL